MDYQTAMNIPAPVYRRVPYNLQGLSWWRQILAVRSSPPRLELLEDWTVPFPAGLLITVPKGFITDGASIPRLLWPLLSPFGPLLEGAILHDFAYQHGYLLTPFSERQVYNIISCRLRAQNPEIFAAMIPVYLDQDQDFFDNMLRQITVETSGATVQANLAYRALRIFGHWAWTEYRLFGPAAFNTNSLNLPGRHFDGTLSRLQAETDQKKG